MKSVWFTGFRPRTHGFHFRNYFMETTIKIPPLEISTNMRGAGMVLAALDYYYAGMPIPLHLPEDFPGGVPRDGTQLPDYILLRTFQCFAANYETLLLWSMKGDTKGMIMGEGVPKLTLVEEIPKLKTALRSGPVPVALVSGHSVSEVGMETSHAVAYGYEDDGRYFTLHAYIADYPDSQSLIVRDKADENAYVVLKSPSASTSTAWRGFFIEEYFPLQPSYHDVRVTGGVGIDPPTARMGQSFRASYSLVNEGEYSVTGSGFGFQWTGPDGKDLSARIGFTGKSTLAIGEALDVSTSALPPQIGDYVLHAAAVGRFGQVQPLYDPPPAGAARFRVKYPAAVTPQYEFLRQSIEKRPDGILGLYAVALRARSENLDPPVSFDWHVSGAYPSSHTGSTVEAMLPTGRAPGPYQKECPAKVTATAVDGSISADFTIQYPRDAHFTVDFSSEYSLSADSQMVSVYGSGRHIMVVYRVHYTQFLVKLEGLEFFRPFGGMVWKPTPVRNVEDNSAVIGPLGFPDTGPGRRVPGLPEPKPERTDLELPPTPGVLVGVTGTDFIGQRISLSETVEPYEFVTYVDTVPIEKAALIPEEWEWDAHHISEREDVPVEMDRSMESIRVAGHRIQLPTAETALDVVRVPAELAKDLDGAVRLRPSAWAVPSLEHGMHR